jgi:hypothetical protein
VAALHHQQRLLVFPYNCDTGYLFRATTAIYDKRGEAEKRKIVELLGEDE